MDMRLFTATCVVLLLANASQHAVAQPVNTGVTGNWKAGVVYTEESVGDGLPVLALDRSDWPNHRSGQFIHSHAWRSIRAELNATHASGWRIAALVRSEAWLDANADAVSLAAYEATRSDPEIALSYTPEARSQGWQGAGVMVGTPWFKLDGGGRWKIQGNAELLQLRKLQTAALAGSVVYQGGETYEFDLRSQRANTSISGPYLGQSGDSGLGATLSLALQGRPTPGWEIQLRADDLASRLSWSDLATDTNALNSQVIIRAPDGSLEYAPLLTGQKTLQQTKRQIGVNWQARVAWSVFQDLGRLGTATLRASRKADISQLWLGWDSGKAGRTNPHWRLELEPSMSAAKAELFWGGWQLSAASDGKGLDTQYRQLSLGWQTDF